MNDKAGNSDTGSSDNSGTVDTSKSQIQATGVPGYIDQVARKETFLGEHPDAVIEFVGEKSPHERWRGHIPGHEEIRTGELGQLLDRLEDQLAADEAHERWPGWTFSRVGGQWKGEETAGTRTVWGPSLGAAEARVRVEGSGAKRKPLSL